MDIIALFANDKLFVFSFVKPSAVKSWDVGSLTCIYYHNFKRQKAPAQSRDHIILY